MTKLLPDKEQYQAITDICFENGGVTKPMVDKLNDLLNTQKKLYAEMAKEEYARQILSDDEVLRFFESRNVNSVLDETIMTFISNQRI